MWAEHGAARMVEMVLQLDLALPVHLWFSTWSVEQQNFGRIVGSVRSVVPTLRLTVKSNASMTFISSAMLSDSTSNLFVKFTSKHLWNLSLRRCSTALRIGSSCTRTKLETPVRNRC